MDIKAETLARKYAQAFLNLYPDAVKKMYKQLPAVAQLLSTSPQFSFISKLPIAFVPLKKDMLKKILEPFQIPTVFDRLIDILAAQQRLALLPLIMQSLAQLYRKKINTSVVIARSSQQLDDQELSVIQKFLESQTQQHIVISPVLDKELIAGLRLQSDTFLWEYSVAQQLNRIERLFDHEHKKF